ncbi:flagellar hook-associated protein 3 [Thermaerobacter marianensis DSM 12885]|uniref:Flagellar hook-associated protein 3 n=1 Tax=Thermaerobacter marianensis (strain ATCC 700841 / DSM 12885 / JCM 10246 / 7p75a) TaxID=644966 RepID=E6SLQ3_THEM7|nr:flagellar hook-associated protein FlgL [Thermaerobacter marianensis]ADU50320.1 flagellar hook-associated protein 3 [Thermaerobacter marianensis DSM 12885]
MRITGGMMITTLLADLRRAQERLSTYQNRLASGKQVQRPSDDPVATVDSLRLRARLAEVDRLRANAEDARDWLEITDSALDRATQILQRARELAIRAASGTLPDSSLDAIAAEVQQLRDHLLEVANTTLGDAYIFGGLATQQPPYVADPASATGVAYQGINGPVEREVAPGTTVAVNVPGDAAFDPAFDALGQMAAALAARDLPTVGGAVVAALDDAIDGLLRFRAEVGAKVNRIELGLYRLDEIRIDTERLLSGVEDADIAETAMRLSVSEAAYRAALMAGARIVQPTLMDFLR